MQDFPARFSPMLVKELRQGMRTNLFSVAFILLQTVMVLSLLAGLAGPGSAHLAPLRITTFAFQQGVFFFHSG